MVMTKRLVLLQRHNICNHRDGVHVWFRYCLHFICSAPMFYGALYVFAMQRLFCGAQHQRQVLLRLGPPTWHGAKGFLPLLL
ncbi:hypothetical protein VIGAN_08160100 [Vigna angularis var. angularis]|uniref:Transmembrane protein n=1 Tax=Vigna angularis var. angularis TaxID=157739 RepID=A0A0S3SQ30_PHAAN|nr:hypothetical protein VIGAN_08160100 [Vigna angularis var. angularis]